MLGVPARLRRQRLASWADKVVKRLRNLGLDVDACTVDDSRALFVPDGHLSLTVDQTGVEVVLALPPSEMAGPRILLADPVRTLELTTALEALPEQFVLGVEGDPIRAVATRTTTDDLRALVDRVEREGVSLYLGWSVEPGLAAEHAATLDEQLQDAVVALGEVLQLFRRVRSQHGSTRKSRRREAARARGEEDREAGERRPRRAREPEPERAEPEVEAEPEAPAEAEGPRGARLLPAGLRPRVGLLRRAGRGTAVSTGPIEKGVRVRVLAGAFMGKVGLVQEVDGEGGARVLLGLLAVRIEVKDLVRFAEGHGRPKLSSSHRKPPVPVRS